MSAAVQVAHDAHLHAAVPPVERHGGAPGPAAARARGLVAAVARPLEDVAATASAGRVVVVWSLDGGALFRRAFQLGDGAPLRDLSLDGVS